MKKRVISIVLVAAMLATFGGCEKKKEEAQNETPSSSVNTAMSAEEYADSIKANAEIYKNYITLPEYKGVEVSVDKSGLEVSDESIESAINSMLTSTAESEKLTEGVTANGDDITLDYSGKLNGEAFANGTATDATYTVGSGKFISDLDEGLVGLTVGKQYEIPCTFPEDYGNDELNGKAVVFEVKVTEISRKKIPELTDQWVKDNSETIGEELSTVDELRTYVKNNLEEKAKSTYNSQKYAAVWEQVSANLTEDKYPQDELDKLVETLKNNIQSEFDKYGASSNITDFATYLSSVYGFESEDAFNEYAVEYAKNYLLEKMFITLVAVDQNLTVTADEINEMGDNLAQYYGYTDYQEILDSYGEEMNAEVGYEVLYQKIQEFIAENAVEK